MEMDKSKAARYRGLDHETFLLSTIKIKNRGIDGLASSSSEESFAYGSFEAENPNYLLSYPSHKQTAKEREYDIENKQSRKDAKRDIKEQTKEDKEDKSWLKYKIYPSSNFSSASKNKRYSQSDKEDNHLFDYHKKSFEEDAELQEAVTPMWNTSIPKEKRLSFNIQEQEAPDEVSQTLTPYSKKYLNEHTPGTTFESSTSTAPKSSSKCKNFSSRKNTYETPNLTRREYYDNIPSLKSTRAGDRDSRNTGFTTPNTSGRVRSILQSRRSSDSKWNTSKLDQERATKDTERSCLKTNLFSKSGKHPGSNSKGRNKNVRFSKTLTPDMRQDFRDFEQHTASINLTKDDE